jgi:hypothetical protein
MSKINNLILESPEKNADIHSNAILETPNLIVLWMVSLIPDSYFISSKTTFFDPACGRGTFLKHIYVKLRQQGHSHQNSISRIFGVDKYSPANETSDIFPNIIKKDFLKMDFPANWPKEFDVIVSNPPYSKYLHLKFLEKCVSIANGKIVFVHPSNSFVNEKGGNSNYVNSNSFLEDKIESVEFFNGNGIFEIDLFAPCSITTVNPAGNGGKISVNNLMNGDQYEAKTIAEITQFKNKPELWNLKGKIDSFVSSNGSLDDIIKDKKSGPYMVEFTRIRGHIDNKGSMSSKILKDDFFTFVKKDTGVERKENSKYDLWFRFQTETEANNFLSFLKTDFARFSLAMYKFAQSLNNGELRFVPRLDFTQEWTDKKLNDLFNITEEEKYYIKEIIPPYYD